MFARARLFTLLFGLIPIAGLAVPTIAAPATQPVAVSSAIDAALTKLSDRDPVVRESAKEQLMGLSPDDLPALHLAIEQARPLPAGDEDVIREIVTHVYLTGDSGDCDPAQGFMGVMMRDYRPVFAGDEAEPALPLGVVVFSRVPGLAAYRTLRDGDVILAISIDGTDELRVHSARDISIPISGLPAGQRVRLLILRQGRRIQTTLTLNARPRELDPNNFDGYCKLQAEKAQAFWAAHFASVVENGIS